SVISILVRSSDREVRQNKPGLRFWIQARDAVIPGDEVGSHAHFVGTGWMTGGVVTEALMAKPTELPPDHWGTWPPDRLVMEGRAR
ncbi:MAG: hypothetical protein ACYSUI_19690, partial [Planctomycetota bacterium]